MPEQPLRARIGARWITITLAALLTLTACSSPSDPTGGSVATTSPTTTSSSTTTTSSCTSTTTTAAPPDVATQSFRVEIGLEGVTYDLDGAPPSGPSSFAVLDDGSVAIADTMAAARGEPRLLHYDRLGSLQGIIDLADEEVAAIVDVVTDGSNLAILDVLVSMGRYRLLTLNRDGDLTGAVDVPPGFRLEDGLTGLAWDDAGILLEFEFGARYARLTENGAIESPAFPVFDGVRVELRALEGRIAEVATDSAAFTIERATDLGGVTLVGIGPDGAIVVVVDEVDMSGPSIVVTRRVQNYSSAGDLQGEYILDAADQFVDIPRPLELDATGKVLYLQSQPDAITVAAIEL